MDILNLLWPLALVLSIIISYKIVQYSDLQESSHKSQEYEEIKSYNDLLDKNDYQGW